MVNEAIVLGHIISEKGIEVDRVKIEVIENFKPPKILGKSEVFLDMLVSTDDLSKTSPK